MDRTVTGIASVVVAELRVVGYMESTIGQYEKTIKALTDFAETRSSTYTPSLGAVFALMTVSPRTGRRVRHLREDRSGGSLVPHMWGWWRASGLQGVHRAGCGVGGRHG